jgi:hypothetical protein
MKRTHLLVIALLAFAVSAQANPFVAGVIKPTGHAFKNFVTWKDPKLNLALLGYGAAISADFYTASRAQARCSTCTVIGGRGIMGLRPSTARYAEVGAAAWMIEVVPVTWLRTYSLAPKWGHSWGWSIPVWAPIVIYSVQAGQNAGIHCPSGTACTGN